MPEPFSPGSRPAMPRIARSLDERAVGLAQVDPEQGFDDAAVADRDARAATWMPEESRPRSPPRWPSMSNPSIVHVVGAHADTLPEPEPDQRGASDADQRDGAIDEQVADVGAGGHLEAGAGRGGVDAGLEG